MNIWYIITALAIAVFLIRKDLAREMILAGILAIPILVLKPIISPNFYSVANSNGGIFLFLLGKIILSFSFGAFASSIYEIFFHKKITPLKHPLRKKLIWLFAGPLIFLVLSFLFKQNVSLSIMIGLVVNLIIVLYVRSDLIWDTIFSGFVMGLLYFVIFAASYSGFPGDIRNLWFSDTTVGITAFSIPIEELVCVFLFGAFWGPLYVAIKDKKEK